MWRSSSLLEIVFSVCHLYITPIYQSIIGLIMAFGFSVGDFILVTQIVLDLRNAYQSAPTGFEALTASLETFHGLIQGIQRDLDNKTSRLGRASPQQLLQLESILRRIHAVLIELEKIRERYQHVELRRRIWDRVTFPRENVRYLGDQLQLYMMGLNLFLESLGAEMLGKILQVLEEMASQDRLVQAEWKSLFGALLERGVAEAVITSHRADIEDIVHAVQDVVQSELQLSPDSSLRSSTGLFSANSSTTDGSTIFGDSILEREDDPSYAVGPPSETRLRSKLCEGALSLQREATGMRQKKRLFIFGSAKWRIECTKCKFVGFQDEKLDNLQSPTNTPLFFAARQDKLTPVALEYHIMNPEHKRSFPSDGLYYRTIFFWKCHVPVAVETLHDKGSYECPFCGFLRSAGLLFTRLELLAHVMTEHVQRQPSLELRKRFNCWIAEEPFLYQDEYNRISGRTFDLLLPRPYSTREATLARIKKDSAVVTDQSRPSRKFRF